MTSDDEDHDYDAAHPEAVEDGGDKTKTTLWRPAADRRRSILEAAILAVVGAAGVATVLGTTLLEGGFFAAPATAMPVTIIAIDSVSHADQYSTGDITYRVSLPDGTQARFTSPRTHKPGTRLIAMVSRGRITGRTLVAFPYVVLPHE